MNMAIAETLKAPFYVRLAATMAVLEMVVSAQAVTCVAHLETGAFFNVAATFNGSHADPYVTKPVASICLLIGDSETRLPVELDDEACRAVCLAIENQIARDNQYAMAVKKAGSNPFGDPTPYFCDFGRMEMMGA